MVVIRLFSLIYQEIPPIKDQAGYILSKSEQGQEKREETFSVFVFV
jgi:hypothetical protein